MARDADVVEVGHRAAPVEIVDASGDLGDWVVVGSCRRLELEQGALASTPPR